MKKKDIAGVVRDSFKTLNKLGFRIVENYIEEDIHDFRVEVKKLRAFLRLVNIKKETRDEPVIPQPLKTFYGHIGILRDIHLLKHDVSRYIKAHSLKTPATYLQLLKKKEDYRKKQVSRLMTNNNFKPVREKILMALPGKLKKKRVKKFLHRKLSALKELLQAPGDDTTMHNIRKILKDILYTWRYIKDHADLPGSIDRKDELNSITATLGNLMDKYAGLQFLQSPYLQKIKPTDEKHLLLDLRKQWDREKHSIKKEATDNLNSLKQRLQELGL